MKRISLDEHIRQSKIAVAANKIKGNRHGQILSMLYADPYHFIEEILQNTEDACRKNENFEDKGKLRVVIHEDAIDIFHNGHPFTEEDLMSISTFANTSKKGSPDINMIGKFGIGFRSVYGISENPEIHSGEFHYKILDYEVLEACESRSNHEFTTLIRLPFKRNLDTNIIESTRKKLLDLYQKLLLFLTHLANIEIVNGAKQLIISRKNVELSNDILRSELKSAGLKQENEQYLLFRKNTHTKRECAIAFKQNTDGTNFVRSGEETVSVYFPTRFKHKNAFLVHGRFTTNPTREQIIFNEVHCPENFRLSSEIGELLYKSMKYLRKEKILHQGFYKLINWTYTASDPLHDSITKNLNKFLAQEKALLNEKGQYKEVSALCLPEHDLLRDLVHKKEIFSLWSRFDFLHEDLCENADFIHYLRKNHKLKNADIDTLAFHIRQHAEFLKKKKFDDLHILYKLLSEFPKYWDLKHADRYYSLRHSPIIPNSKKELKPAFHSDGRPAIFLGEIKGNVPLVHPDIASNAENRNFFAMLGIPEGSPGLAETEKLIKGLRNHNANPTLYKLFLLYFNGNSTLKERIRSILGNTKCIRTIASQNGDKNLCKPTDAYLQNEQLEKFFGTKNTLFVSNDLYKYFDSNEIPEEEYISFLTDIGVNALPRIIPLQSSISDRRKKELRAEFEIHPIVKETVYDFTIDGLDEFLSFPSFEASTALWSLMCSMSDDYFEAYYTFESYVRTETVKFLPEFIEVLRKNAFFYDKNLDVRYSDDLTTDSIHEAYKNNTPACQKLFGLFGIDSGFRAALSNKEEQLINYIRNNGLDPGEFLTGISEEVNNELSITYFKPGDTLTSEEVGANLSVSQNLMLSLPFKEGYFPEIEALENHLSEATSEIREYLLRQVYAKSPGIHIETESYGILRIVDDSQFLSYAFIAKTLPGGYLMAHPNLEKLLAERPDRKDIILYVLQKTSCRVVEAEYLDNFVRNNIVLSLRRMKFIR